jgi:hypothetical protein
MLPTYLILSFRPLAETCFDFVIPSARSRAERGESAEEPAFPLLDPEGRGQLGPLPKL